MVVMRKGHSRREKKMTEREVEKVWPKGVGSGEPADPTLVQPANLVKGSPELGRLVDIDLARLLGIGLAELLAHPETFEAPDKHASLAGQIRSTVETQICSQHHLVGVQQALVRVGTQVDGGALPINLKAVALVGK